MSPKLPVVSGPQIVRALERRGFQQVGQRGSHVKLRRSLPDGIRTVIVPLHHELAPGTLKSILRQAGLTIEELEGLL